MHKARKQHTTLPPNIANAVHPEIAKLIEAESYDIPKELRHEFYTIIDVGPYVKYRWTEGKRTYTISLGLDDDYPPYPFTPQGF